jgi:hypothetical protein
MAMTKLKVALGVVILAVVGTAVVLEYQALARLRQENLALQQQVEQLTRQAAERQRRPEPKVQVSKPTPSRDRQLGELNRLRGELGALARQTSELAALQAENTQLRAATGEPEDAAEAEFKEETIERMNHQKQWALSFHLYAQNHNDQFPATFDQAAGAQQTESLLDFATNNLEIVYQGAVKSITNAGQTILFREKQARRSPKGEWIKVYGFADGHVETHAEPDGNFEAWEKQHIVAPQ